MSVSTERTTERVVPVSVVETRLGQEVAVRGRLDVHTVADVRLALHDVIDRGQGDLLIHLADAEVHDATGLGVIVGAHHRARRAGRRVVLVDLSPRLDRLLRATRLHRVLVRAYADGALECTDGGLGLADAPLRVVPLTA